MRTALSIAALCLWACTPGGPTVSLPEPPAAPAVEVVDPCEVKLIEKMDVPSNLYLSPDGKRFAANQKDLGGIYQVYVGEVGAAEPSRCISCGSGAGAPQAGKHKLMVSWHPSGEWIFVGVENEHWTPWIPAWAKEGLLQSGIDLDMWVAKADGSAWFRFTHFPPEQSGYTGPAISPDGKKLFWAHGIDGNVFVYPFGKWELNVSDFSIDAAGVPSLKNTRVITPEGANWVEPGNVSPDGKKLLLTLDTGLTNANGMDQWLMDIETGAMTNLTSSPGDWDEHGLFAPNSNRIVLMTSKPYHAEYDATKGTAGLKTEFMLMDADGKNPRQLTHFSEKGFVESTEENNLAAVAYFTPDGRQLIAAQLLTGPSFPRQLTWRIVFAGRCG